MNAMYNKVLFKGKGHEHFESIQGLFYNRIKKYKIVSTNGFAIDPSHFDQDYRISRFVRDPRDLVVSGYYYHLNGNEPWFKFKSPSETYWSSINGTLPQAMPIGVSYQEYLRGLSLEEGLLAELEFRQKQFSSLRDWDHEDPKIRIWKYEDILGNEEKVFNEMFNFYKLTEIEKRIGRYFVKKYAYQGSKSLKQHIRNPDPGQWQGVFTKKVEEVFNERFVDVLDRLNYLV